MNKNNKLVLLIHVLFWVIYHYCLTMVVPILVYKNLKLKFVMYLAWLKTISTPYKEKDKKF